MVYRISKKIKNCDERVHDHLYATKMKTRSQITVNDYSNIFLHVFVTNRGQVNPLHKSHKLPLSSCSKIFI